MMNNIKNVPEIRFKDFYGEWKQGFLKDNVEFYSGLTYKPSDVCKKSSSSVLVIRSSNIKNGKFVLNNDDVYVKEEALNSTITEMNDIAVVVRNGSRPLIGKHGIVTKYLKKTTVGAFMTGIRAYRFNFINILLDTNAFRKQVDENMGATINQITNSTLNLMCFYFPNSNEQEQIGNFFKNLDEKLELEKEKYQKLISFKKAMLEDMFPKKGEKVPKVRFKSFDDEWENFKIEDIGDVRTGKTPQTSDSSNYSDNGILFITPTDIKSNITRTTERCLSNKGSLLSTIVEPGTTLVTCIASIGKNTLIEERSAFNQQINSITPYNSNPYFIYTLSYKWSEKMRIMAATGTMQIVNKKEFSKINTLIPSPEEQALIGNFFKNLDEKIELSEQKIAKIENFKKAMLDKMFV